MKQEKPKERIRKQKISELDHKNPCSFLSIFINIKGALPFEKRLNQ